MRPGYNYFRRGALARCSRSLDSELEALCTGYEAEIIDITVHGTFTGVAILREWITTGRTSRRTGKSDRNHTWPALCEAYKFGVLNQIQAGFLDRVMDNMIAVLSESSTLDPDSMRWLLERLFKAFEKESKGRLMVVNWLVQRVSYAHSQDDRGMEGVPTVLSLVERDAVMKDLFMEECVRSIVAGKDKNWAAPSCKYHVHADEQCYRRQAAVRRQP